MSAPTLAASRLPEIGDLVDGKYRVEALLGQGGMGAVFRAVHAHTGRTVALKVIVPRFAADESFLKRFEREARAAGSLRHPNIVDVTDFGYAQTPSGRLAYLVMEFLEGCSLADVLKQQAGLPLAWSVDVLEQIGGAVEEAHRAGLLHRDLKPDNIWLEPNRKGGYTVKVLDFGLAKIASSAEEKVEHGELTRRQERADADVEGETRIRGDRSTPKSAALDDDNPTSLRPVSNADDDATSARPTLDAPHESTTEQATAMGAIVGTPAYMSPEQCRGALLTPASDVYSLGVIAYRMLAGRLPFEGTADAQIDAHLRVAPPDIRKLRGDLPLDATDLLMQALAKRPEDRPKSAGAFAAMISAKAQPTSDFLRSAVFLFIQHAGTFLRASILWMSPALVLVAITALVAILEASGTGTLLSGIPPYGFIFVPQVLGFMGVLALQGAIVPAVMQAIVAPLQPIDLSSLTRAFSGRMKSYVRGIMPLVGLMAGIFVWTFVIVRFIPPLLRPLRPLLVGAPRPVLVLLVTAIMGPLVFGPLFFFRKSAIGSAFQFLGSVAMVEGRTSRAALDRAATLARASGRALHAVTLVSMIIGLVFGFILSIAGLALPRGLPDWGNGPLQAVFICVAMVFLAPFLSVVSALTYLRAIKAAGESPDDVLRSFERQILPASHWKLATRDRILTQIDATRG